MTRCRAPRLRHGHHYKEVLSRADRLYRAGGETLDAGLYLFDVDAINIRQALDWCADNFRLDPDVARLCCAYARAAPHLLPLRCDLRACLRWAKSARAASSQLGDREAEAGALWQMGVAFAMMGNHKQAIECHTEQLAIATELRDEASQSAALGNLGLQYRHHGDLQRAIECHEKALDLCPDADLSGQAAALGGLAAAHLTAKNRRAAIQLLEQQIAVAREANEPRSEEAALGNLGIVHAMLGNSDRARSLYDEALSIARSIGDRPGEGKALAAIAGLYLATGRSREALGLYDAAISIARDTGHCATEALQLYNKSTALARIGLLPAAIDAAVEALRIREDLGLPDADATRQAIEVYRSWPRKRRWRFWRRTL